MSTDFTGMIDFATRLADTVRQAQAATNELEQMRKAYAELQGQCASLEATLAHRQDAINDLHHSLDATKTERDAAQHKAQEVSEALAAATATLNTFRGLLGLDNGKGAPEPSKDNPPAPMASSNADAGADAASGEVRVDPAPAPRTGGVEQGHAPQVSPFTGSETQSSDVGPASIQSEPSAPEVAEPRPTGENDSHSAAMTGGEQGGPISWRDSASHVAYRPFGF